MRRIAFLMLALLGGCSVDRTEPATRPHAAHYPLNLSLVLGWAGVPSVPPDASIVHGRVIHTWPTSVGAGARVLIDHVYCGQDRALGATFDDLSIYYVPAGMSGLGDPSDPESPPYQVGEKGVWWIYPADGEPERFKVYSRSRARLLRKGDFAEGLTFCDAIESVAVLPVDQRTDRLRELFLQPDDEIRHMASNLLVPRERWFLVTGSKNVSATTRPIPSSDASSGIVNHP